MELGVIGSQSGKVSGGLTGMFQKRLIKKLHAPSLFVFFFLGKGVPGAKGSYAMYSYHVT